MSGQDTCTKQFAHDCFAVYGTLCNRVSINGYSKMTEKEPQRPPDDVGKSMDDNSSYSFLIEIKKSNSTYNT